MSDIYGHGKYLVRRKFWRIFGGEFAIFDTAGMLLFYAEQKAFRLREDIRLYGSRLMDNELICIKARQIIDFSAAYDVVDSRSLEKVGALKRRGWKSILKDEWIVMNSQDQEIALVQEESPLLAFLRRFLTNLIPQQFIVSAAGRKAAVLKQRFNPFVLKMDVEIDPGQREIDPRLIIALALLLAAIEGRQN